MKISLAVIFLIVSTGCSLAVPLGAERRPTEASSVISDQTDVPLPTGTPVLQVESRVVIDQQPIDDFGWLSNELIYYSIKDVLQTKWYSYDLLTGLTEKMESPHPAMDFLINKPVVQIVENVPGLDPTIFTALTDNGKADVVNVALSPSGKAAVYTRLPIGYVRPTPEPHYIDPLDLWVTSSGGVDSFMLQEQFSYECGGNLDSRSKWFYDETFMIGSCGDYDTYYFYVDVLKQKFDFITFDTIGVDVMRLEDAQISPYDLEPAHQSPSSAFVRGGLWIVNLENGARAIPVKLDNSSIYIPHVWVISPRWSFDDQWVYYWRIGEVSGQDTNGFDQRPWWLERVNVSSRQTETVLRPNELRAVVGNQLYDVLTVVGGYHINKWQLSPDGHQALLFMGQTKASPNELFLISW